jgi:succinyl-CoA synthetase beta subunit
LGEPGFLKLYEHEAKAIFSNYGIPTPKGELAETSNQARIAAEKLKGPVAVKAQVLVAGRGKAGGILFAKSAQEAEESAQKLLNTQIKGTPVTKVLVEEQIKFQKELYFGLTVDRLNRCFVAVASQVGGVEIEEVAKQHPQKIFKQPVNPRLGFRNFHARQLAKSLGYSGEKLLAITDIFLKMYQASVDLDAELIEMNPIVETPEGKFVAVDTRIILDDNALFRHQEYAKVRVAEPRELSPQEFEAQENDLAYVKLNGDIGVAGNGAGLVMATMDLINFFGGKPANFLDMGGGASPERIEAAFRIIFSDGQVRVLFVNILGGITLCDEVARGIIGARKQLHSSKPLVVRLVGTNEAEGKRILADASVQAFDSMEEAAQKAVQLAKEER